MKLILASTSKFKSEILNKVNLKHLVLENNFDESTLKCDDVYEYVMNLAYGKANSVKCKKDSIILGLDTVLYVNNKILEKPKDIEEAKDNIRISSNNISKVITGICLINTNTKEIVRDYQETLIELNNISEEDIEFYIKNEKDALYVSGFVIENTLSNFVKKIDGSYYNILGIPVEKIYSYLLKWNIHLCDLD